MPDAVHLAPWTATLTVGRGPARASTDTSSGHPAFDGCVLAWLAAVDLGATSAYKVTVTVEVALDH